MLTDWKLRQLNPNVSYFMILCVRCSSSLLYRDDVYLPVLWQADDLESTWLTIFLCLLVIIASITKATLVDASKIPVHIHSYQLVATQSLVSLLTVSNLFRCRGADYRRRSTVCLSDSLWLATRLTSTGDEGISPRDLLKQIAAHSGTDGGVHDAEEANFR